jgi:hypothetical protein
LAPVTSCLRPRSPMGCRALTRALPPLPTQGAGPSELAPVPSSAAEGVPSPICLPNPLAPAYIKKFLRVA